ncbi:hypothetical protein [Arthrobacter sp. U41]|uniref:hypothetical protein n=1 Tax=Arthrobacter sp. U41 TaxID=1849032 RepID=UPI0008592923|nr:hypothetical protein [Arthrobacter sp. U41]AOT05033.1 hypothetical protein ASPU41_18615 [Arthrobacter sp. U41]
METRVKPGAPWGRIGAVALPLGVILLVAATAVHPSREDVMNHTAVFGEYAQSDGWIAIHFTQWAAALVFFGGLVALYFAMTAKQEGPTALARFGLAAVVLTAAGITMLQAVDGVALKWAVDSWANAPADQESSAFSAAMGLRWTEYALQSYSNILLGLTLIFFGLAIAYGNVYSRWPGWLAAGSGAAWIVHGLMVSYVGLFDSAPRLVALLLMAVWAFVMAVQMWPGGRRGRTARTAAPAGPVTE